MLRRAPDAGAGGGDRAHGAARFTSMRAGSGRVGEHESRRRGNPAPALARPTRGVPPPWLPDLVSASQTPPRTDDRRVRLYGAPQGFLKTAGPGACARRPPTAAVQRGALGGGRSTLGRLQRWLIRA